MRMFCFVALVFLSFNSCSGSDESTVVEIKMEDEMSTSLLFQGDFVSSAHPTSGKAAINDAKTLLSLTNFKTDNGPVLEVYLATDTSATTYITLGALKGIDGNYDYVLPNNIDFNVYNHIIIWCVDFKVNFGYAVLK